MTGNRIGDIPQQRSAAHSILTGDRKGLCLHRFVVKSSLAHRAFVNVVLLH